LEQHSLLEDKELKERVDRGILSKEFLDSDKGKLLLEAAHRKAEYEIRKFVYKADLDNKTELAEIRATIRKYKYEFLKDLLVFEQEAEIAFREAESRDSFGELYQSSTKT
jgi:hypothetical protein